MNNNLLVAPQFPDGEIVNAFLIRMSSYSGSQSFAMACRQLLHRKPGLDGMPSFLGRFHEEVGHVYGDIDTIIDKHTEYNFFCCGLPRSRFEAQRARLIQMHRGPVRLARLPLLYSESEARFFQCAECAEQQEKEFGFTFIHRRTGAPFVNVCPHHGLEIQCKSSRLLLFDRHCKSTLSNYQRIMTMELGKRIEDCMEKPVTESGYHKDDLLLLLKGADWIGSDERFHLREFVDAFTKFFAGAFADERLSLMCLSKKHVESAIRSLTRVEKALHPEWCVLFRWFAEVQPRSTPSCGGSAALGAPHPKKRAHSTTVPLRAEIEAAMARHRTLRATAKTMGLSVPLLSTYCKRYGVKVSWRPKKITAQISSEIVDALRAGMHPNEAAEEFNISPSSAYRLLVESGMPLPTVEAKTLRTEEDKTKWRLLVLEHPNASRNALRRLQPNLWMRLNRNAEDWLEENLPAPLPAGCGVRARPSVQLSSKLNLALADATKACSAADHIRMHMSRYRLQDLTGVTLYALKRCEETGSVERREESREAFVDGRLARLTKSIGRPVQRFSLIAKEAGLRTETVRKALKKERT
ncbi:TnsD family Tn7-like transposition protein [Duganella sp. Root198D2]|uniref:TnsD family Tn7-like transposition protein n=1 Tax=Duganella sp. Root198D2 TaxID=1736489 RepID=UPI00138F62BD|nr:TnsD family Tn7-like transposition protein [Duganella sp. Root198D2]